MEKMQAFIDKYGTHYIRAASFGGRFYIRVVSTSESFKSFNDFSTAADIESNSMQGKSSSRKNQISSAVDSKHSTKTSTSTDRKTGTSSQSSEQNQEFKSSSMELFKASVGASAGTGGLGGGMVNVGGSISMNMEMSSSSSESRFNSAENAFSSSSGVQTSSTAAREQAFRDASNLQNEITNEALNEAKQSNKNSQKAMDTRDQMSKSKSIYYHIDGGTDTRFTSYYYTEEYPKYFAKWIHSVSQDPKPYDLRVKLITDLLKISAYDFFPDCTLQCQYNADANCLIGGNFPNGTESQELFSCHELGRITRMFERKNNNLQDAIHMYLNNGRLTPESRQIIQAGHKGCTDQMLLAQRQLRRIRYTTNATYTELIQNMVKMNFHLPRDVVVYFVKSLSMPKNCDTTYEMTLFESDAEVFVLYDEEDFRWIPCLDGKGTECSLNRKSPPMDMVIDEATGDRIIDVIPNPICYSFICLSYNAGHAYVTEGTLKIFDYFINKMNPVGNLTSTEECITSNYCVGGDDDGIDCSSGNAVCGDNSECVSRTSCISLGSQYQNSTSSSKEQYKRNIILTLNELNCTESEATFIANGMDIVTQDVYLTLEATVGKKSAEIFEGDEDVVEDDNFDVWSQTVPAVPVFCNVAFHNAQKFNLKEENQCIYYAVQGNDEYFLVFSDNPSDEDSMYFMHHNKEGICFHGPGIINSRCIESAEAAIISDDNINNNMFLCFNYTAAHESLAEHNEWNTTLIIPDQLNVRIGVPNRITERSIGGDVLFEHLFMSNETLLAANGEPFFINSTTSGSANNQGDYITPQTRSFFGDDSGSLRTVDEETQGPDYNLTSIGGLVTTLFKPKYYAFASGSVDVNILRVSILNSAAECEPGFYDDSDGKNACKPCPVGTYQFERNQDHCLLCRFGYYQNEVGQLECIQCPRGHYQDELGQEFCKPCREGTYPPLGAALGATTAGVCSISSPTGTYCPAGCSLPIDCPKGTYQDQEEQGTCKPCPGGQYQPDTGKTSCDECGIGHYGLAPVNNTDLSNYEDIPEIGGILEHQTCILCPAGTYNDETGQPECHLCPLGVYSTTIGSTDPTCVDCASNECGYCPVGFYGAELGLKHPGECTPCAEGTYKNIAADLICNPCPHGTYANVTGQRVCTECHEGSYSDETGLIDCKVCPGGYKGVRSLIGSTKMSRACSPCEIGTYSDPGQMTCTECPPGYWNDRIGRAQCTGCRAGYRAF